MEAQAINNITNLQLFGHYYHNRTNNLYIVTKFVKVKQGDTLEAIAKKYKVSVKKLKIDNKKNSSKLKIGENIEIIK